MAPNTNRITTDVSMARMRMRAMAVVKAPVTSPKKRRLSSVSWVKAWTVRMALMVSSAKAPTSATRSWLARERRRTLRPKIMIGATTTGTTRNTRPVSTGLVTNSMTMPPSRLRALRSAMDADEPITVCKSVVSVVRRDKTSPVLVVSKKPACRVITRSNTAWRKSATTRSPSQETR